MTADLTTRYLGLSLPTPLIASPGPTTGDPANWARLEAAGAGAIILPSLFEEEVEAESWWLADVVDAPQDAWAEAGSMLPVYEDHALGPDRFLDLVSRATRTVDIPVIASLNGTTAGGWVSYARALEEAGADAIELNVYEITTGTDVGARAVEDRIVALVRAVRAQMPIPLSVKLGPGFTAPLAFAQRLAEAGADGVVLFNHLYQPDIRLDGPAPRVVPNLVLSTPSDIRQALTWVGIMAGRVPLSLGATGGVDSATDVTKLILAGADAVMTTASLLRHGLEHMTTLVEGLQTWLDDNGYVSVDQARGSVSLTRTAEPEAYSRSNYYQTIHSWGR